MTRREVETIIEQAKKLGIYFIGILGGEPLLRKDLLQIIEDHPDMAFRLSTNGTVWDDAIVESLKRCGNVVTFFSLEGLEGETDAWRGAGVFQKIREAMSVLKRERVLFGFSALLHTRNVAEVVSERFLEAMQQAGCKFGLFFPYGPSNDNARYDLALTREEIKSAFAQLVALEDKYPLLLIKEGHCAPAQSGKYFLEQGCRAGVSVHITPEGYVEPCNGIQFYTENVFEKGLEQVFRSPFYNDISSCVQRNGKHCIAMHEPKEIIEIVKKHGARGSHPRAFPTYARYAENVLQLRRESSS
jgi:MoaA/NifB/PqqE/SkfB family radical SAM enzyme